MMKYKIYFALGIAALIAGLCVFISVQKNTIKKLRAEYISASNNYNALVRENSSLKSSNRQFTLTMEQLNSSQDSLLKEMNKMRKELKLKDKQIEALGYINSTASKKDTLYLKDTVFVENTKIDTLIKAEPWYKCAISLEFPGKIAINPEFISEKYLITSTRKEYLEPRKKCFISRMFQRKVTVVETEVIEKNPYIKNNKERFIEIVK